MSSLANVYIQDYNAQSFVLRGDTKPHKDSIKMASGKWNPSLQGGPGWIFPMTMKPKIENFLKTGVVPAPESRFSSVPASAGGSYNPPNRYQAPTSYQPAPSAALEAEIRELRADNIRLWAALAEICQKTGVECSIMAKAEPAFHSPSEVAATSRPQEFVRVPQQAFVSSQTTDEDSNFHEEPSSAVLPSLRHKGV